jgi:hypothetical protein
MRVCQVLKVHLPPVDFLGMTRTLVDGFVVEDQDPLLPVHIAIAGWSRQAWEARKAKMAGVDPAKPVRGMKSAERVKILSAAYSRLGWMQGRKPPENSNEADHRMYDCAFVGSVIAYAYAKKLAFDDSGDLENLLQLAVPVCYNRAASIGPLTITRDHLQHHAFRSPLAEGLRSYARKLEGHTCGTCRDARFELKLFLWLDESVPCDPSSTWAEFVRAEYRRLPAEEKTAWRRIFSHFRPKVSKRPGKPWLRQIQAAITRLGKARFEAAFCGWLAPLNREPRPKVEPLDSNLLRNLLWCATIAPSAALDAAVAPLAAMYWRPKSGMDKIRDPIEAYMAGRPGEISAPALAAISASRKAMPAPLSPQELAAAYKRKTDARLLKSVDPTGQRVRHVGAVYEVDGNRGRYVYEPATGRISDRDSGAELEFDFASMEFFLRYQLESGLKLKLWVAVVATLLKDEELNVRLLRKKVPVQ